MTTFKDLTGKRFGRLFVVKRSESKFYGTKKRQKYTMWECECDCGKKIIVSSTHLLRKNYCTVSCGCYGKEQRKKLTTKHGLCNSRIYNIRKGMIRRCYNKKFKGYDIYG